MMTARPRPAGAATPRVEPGPRRWIGKVRVTTTDGRFLTARVDEPKGDPGNSLTRAELEAKAIRLAGFRAGATTSEMLAMIERIWVMYTDVDAAQILPK